MIVRKYTKKMDRGPGSQFETNVVSKILRAVDSSSVWYDQDREAYYCTLTRDQLRDAFGYSPTTKSIGSKLKKQLTDCQLFDPARDYRQGSHHGDVIIQSEFDIRIPDRFLHDGEIDRTKLTD